MIYVDNRKKIIQFDPNKYTNSLPLSLTMRGVHQAQRNNSDSIWSLMNQSSQQTVQFIKQQQKNTMINEKNFTRNTMTNENKQHQDQIKQKLSQTKAQTQFINTKKSVSFKQDTLKNQIKTKNSTIKQAQLSQSQRQKLQQQAKSKQKYKRQCYSINKYLQSLKPYTRQMPNSAVRLFYDKPCLQSYGRQNVKNSVNNLMKTHNVQPHRHSNQPKKYQTYRSALNFGKRTKLDPQDKWKRIHRQMSSKLDLKQLVSDYSVGFIPFNDDNMKQTLKGSINKIRGQFFQRPKSLQNLRKVNVKSLQKQNSDLQTTKGTDQNPLYSKLKRSKSWGKKQYLFLYKYTNKDGFIQYAKDRHGITNYVDPTFAQNKQAYDNWLKKVNPIQAQDVAPQDRNIDKIMIANYVKSKQEDPPKHYLMPVCDEPYRAQKFSIKGRKKLLSQTRATQAQKE